MSQPINLIMINQIEERLKKFISKSPDPDLPKAAVLIALTDEEEPEILYTLRSRKLSSHSGEVSFPGGMLEEGDNNLLNTALRESKEEIGLKESEVRILGSLDPMVSRFNISVSPYIGVIPSNVKLNTDSEEIEACFTVPLLFFLEDKRFRNDLIKRNDKTFFIPAYKYESYVIWGLTAMITVDFLNLTVDANIDLWKPGKSVGEKNDI